MIRGREIETLLGETAHRPWPLPAGPWVMVQQWRRLLFAHWPVAARVLEPLLPEGVVLDRFAGSAWVSATPFLATVRPRALPPVPLVSHFAELNLRTYVVRDGRPGVWFFSLDATGLAAVLGARIGYGLPYFPARAAVALEDGATRYALRGWRPPWRTVTFAASYRPTSPVASAAPGTLAHWLVERYRLYTVGRRGGVWFADIHHRPWPLQQAEGDVVTDDLARAAGVPVPAERPLVHYADRIDVLVWPPYPA